MNMTVAKGPALSTRVLDDLETSGLEPADMRVRALEAAQLAACGAVMNSQGYVIPYYGFDGKPIQHYRVKLFDQQVKYRQPGDTPNHIYFPPDLHKLLPTAKYLLVTEGEKKAAAAVKAGFPCVALGGVDNWRTRTLLLPKDTSMATKANGTLSLRLPAGKNVTEGADTLAHGLQEMIDWAANKGIPLIICFDTDVVGGRPVVKHEVQRAAATFGFELRSRGIPLKNVRQIMLPALAGDKTGLDDYLAYDPDTHPDILQGIIDACFRKRTAFPRHPNIRDFVHKRLQRTQMPRSEQMGTAMAILSDLDAKGQRLRGPDSGILYYFSQVDKTLTKVALTGKPDFAESPFGRRLYRDYGLGINDQRVLGWISTLYSGEDPVLDVYPEKVMTWRGDTLYLHINGGMMCKINKDRIEMLDNGEDEVLFEAGLIDDIPTEEFNSAIAVQMCQPVENWWYSTLQEARLRKDTQQDRHRHLLALLYYIAPLFFRWRGTQLPVEITVGEAGSGKSTMYSLRLTILTGIAKLRNAPNDLKDWNASLAGTGGLHVTDNLGIVDAMLRQRLSDEICRLVTEPKPSIEQRKLYSDTELVNIPVRCSFAVTAVKQPFQNIDIIQRSIITELDKGTDEELTYDAQWMEHQLEKRGGRAHWLAHTVLFIQRLLQVIDKNWNSRYQARYRLVNLEQLLRLAALTLGEDDTWIPQHLERSRDEKAIDADWALKGLVDFAQMVRERYKERATAWQFPAQEIVSWAMGEDEYDKCEMLTNIRYLTRYLTTNKHTVATSTGIVPHEMKGNRQVYKLDH